MQIYARIVRYNVWKVDAKLRTYSEIQLYGRWMQSYTRIVRYNVWKVDAKLRTYSEIQCMEGGCKVTYV